MSARTMMPFAAAWLAGIITACHAQNPETNAATMKLHLTATAFANGQPIPRRHTSDDLNLSPALQWSGLPPAAKSLALICDDPDAPAGTWVHWVVYDLPRPLWAFRRGCPNRRNWPTAPSRGSTISNHLLRRAGSAARPPAPLLLQTLRPRHQARSQTRSRQKGLAPGDGRPRPGRGTIDGNLPAEVD